MSKTALPPMSTIGQKGPPQSFTAVFQAKQSDRRKQQLEKGQNPDAPAPDLKGVDGSDDSLPEPAGSAPAVDASGGSTYGSFMSKFMESLKSCYGSGKVVS